MSSVAPNVTAGADDPSATAAPPSVPASVPTTPATATPPNNPTYSPAATGNVISDSQLCAELLITFKDNQSYIAFKTFVLSLRKGKSTDLVTPFLHFLSAGGDALGFQFFADLSRFDVRVPADGFCGYQALAAIYRSARLSKPFVPVDLRRPANVGPFILTLKAVEATALDECKDSLERSDAFSGIISQVSGIISFCEKHVQEAVRDRSVLKGLPSIDSRHYLDLTGAISSGLFSSVGKVFVWCNHDSLPQLNVGKYSHMYQIQESNSVTLSAQSASVFLWDLLSLSEVPAYHLVQVVDHFNILRLDASKCIADLLRDSIVSLLTTFCVDHASSSTVPEAARAPITGLATTYGDI